MWHILHFLVYDGNNISNNRLIDNRQYTKVIIVTIVAPILRMCQTIMAEWWKIIDTVFTLVLILDLSLSVYKVVIFLQTVSTSLA